MNQCTVAQIEYPSKLGLLADKLGVWLQKVGKDRIFFILSSLLLIVSLIAYLNRSSEPTYAKEKEIGALQAKFLEEPNEENLAAFAAVIGKNPILAKRYDAQIAKTLLRAQRGDLAAPYLKSILARVDLSHFPLYQEFANTTVLIAGGDLSSALEKSLALQEKCSDDPLLSSCNRIRIVGLQEKINPDLAKNHSDLTPLYEQALSKGS